MAHLHAPPTTQPVQFRDLGTVVDELHALFETWERRQALCPPLDPFSVEVMKFAVHEWVANLVQHADFGAGAPVIEVMVEPSETQVRCTIEDNSRGFDFEFQLAQQQEAVEAPTPPERGRGLLMLIACTEGLHYHQPEAAGDAARGSGPSAGRHRLEFTISASNRPWIDIPF